MKTLNVVIGRFQPVHNGPVDVKWPLFDEIRQYVLDQYKEMPLEADSISTQMYYKIN